MYSRNTVKEAHTLSWLISAKNTLRCLYSSSWRGSCQYSACTILSVTAWHTRYQQLTIYELSHVTGFDVHNWNPVSTIVYKWLQAVEPISQFFFSKKDSKMVVPTNRRHSTKELIKFPCTHTHPFNGPFSGTTRGEPVPER